MAFLVCNDEMRTPIFGGLKKIGIKNIENLVLLKGFEVERIAGANVFLRTFGKMASYVYWMHGIGV